MSTVIHQEDGAGPPEALRDFARDWAADQEVFRHVHWGKAMMWIFLLSDTFIFSCFLTSYMTMRSSVTVPWPNPSEVFALTIGGNESDSIRSTLVRLTNSGLIKQRARNPYISVIEDLK